MLRRLARSQAETAFFLLRFFAGALFLCHGLQKLFGLMPADGHGAVPTGTLAWWAGLIELVCGAAIALGLFTRLAAFLASGEMAVAYFQVHWKPPGTADFFPIVNHGELAVLYCFVFLFIAARGAGRVSLDAAFSRRTTVSAPVQRAPAASRQPVTTT